MKKSAPDPAEFIQVRVQKTQARFKRVRVPNGPDIGVGEFFLLIDITALKDAVYIPTSIASGKKPTGFVYQIEGTALGTISSTNISSQGEGVSQVTLGTLVYTKIPAGVTATFRLLIEMKGKVPKTYSIVINRIHFKHDPSDARYERLPVELGTPSLQFD